MVAVHKWVLGNVEMTLDARLVNAPSIKHGPVEVPVERRGVTETASGDGRWVGVMILI
jgi:hypothetical protein